MSESDQTAHRFDWTMALMLPEVSHIQSVTKTDNVEKPLLFTSPWAKGGLFIKSS